MTVLFSMSMESIFLDFTTRIFAFLTLVFVGAWLLARVAGANNPSFRSSIWTTSLLLALLFPFIAIAGQLMGMQWIRVPIAGFSQRDNLSIDATSEYMKTAYVSPPSKIAPTPPDPLSGGIVKSETTLSSETKNTASPLHTNNNNKTDETSIHRDFKPPQLTQLACVCFACIWIFGIAFGFLRLAFTYTRIRRLLATTSYVNSARLDRIASDVQKSIGMKWKPRIETSQHATSAFAVFHGFRGRIVLPERMLSELPDKELRDIITHEFAHLHRFDPILGLFQTIATIVYWPHPLVHLAKREFIKSREEVCDNYVLQSSDPIDYAKTLLVVAERGLMGAAVDGATSFSSNGVRLEDRIEGLLSEERRNNVSPGFGPRAIIVGGLGLLTLFCVTSRFGIANQESTSSFPWHSKGIRVAGDERGRTWGILTGELDLSPDGTQLATADQLGNVYLWNSNTLSLERHFQIDRSLRAVRYTSDGTRLIAIRRDKPALVVDLMLDTESTKEVEGLSELNITTWSGDHKRVLINHSELCQISSTGEKKKISWIQLYTESDYQDFDRGLMMRGQTLSYDGKMLGAVRSLRSRVEQSSGRADTIEADRQVIVWNTESNSERRFVINQESPVRAMTFSQDSRLLAISGIDRKISIIDITGESPVRKSVFKLDGDVRGFCFHPNGKILAVASKDLELWSIDGEIATLLASTPTIPIDRNRLYGPSLSMVFSPRGDALFFADGEFTVRRWDFQTNQQPNVDRHQRRDYCRFVNSDSTDNRLITFEYTNEYGRPGVFGYRNGELVVRDLNTLQSPPTVLFKTDSEPVRGLCISKDEKRVAFFSHRESKTKLELWQLSTDGAKPLDSVELDVALPRYFAGLSFSPDGKTVVSGCKHGAIQVWDVSRGTLRQRASVPNDAQLCDVRGIQFSPDGQSFASIGSPGGVNLWHLGHDDGVIKKIRSIGNSIDGVVCMRFSNDGKTLATGDDQGRIKLWSLDNDKAPPTSFTLHKGSIHSIQYRSKDDKILSSGDDGQVILWDLKASKIERIWQYPGPVYDARFDPTENKVITNNANGSIYVCEH